MCEYCSLKIYVQIERYSRPILAPLTEVEQLEYELINKTNDGNLRERLYLENGIMKELLGGNKQ